MEFGQIDVQLETSQLSSFLGSSRIGHLIQALHIFHYLQHDDSSWMPMDPTKLDIEYKGPQKGSPQKHCEVMKYIYCDAHEEIVDNVPEPRGKSVQTNGENHRIMLQTLNDRCPI